MTFLIPLGRRAWCLVSGVRVSYPLGSAVVAAVLVVRLEHLARLAHLTQNRFLQAPHLPLGEVRMHNNMVAFQVVIIRVTPSRMIADQRKVPYTF